MRIIKEIKVEKDCKISSENPTPSKKYTDTIVNIEANDTSGDFVNFTFAGELEKESYEDFKIIRPDSYEYENVYVCHITVLQDEYEYYESVIVNILIRNVLWEYEYLTFVVANVSDYYTHTIYFDENNELAYESDI